VRMAHHEASPFAAWTTGLGIVIVFFSYIIIIGRNPTTQKPYGSCHSVDRSMQLAAMRGRRVWARVEIHSILLDNSFLQYVADTHHYK